MASQGGSSQRRQRQQHSRSRSLCRSPSCSGHARHRVIAAMATTTTSLSCMLSRLLLLLLRAASAKPACSTAAAATPVSGSSRRRSQRRLAWPGDTTASQDIDHTLKFMILALWSTVVHAVSHGLAWRQRRPADPRGALLDFQDST